MKKTPDTNHFIRLEQYAGNVQKMYEKALLDISRLLSSITVDPSKPFRFDDYPEIKHLVNGYLQSLSDKVQIMIENAISEEWIQGNAKGEAVLQQVLRGSDLTDAQKQVYLNRNMEGLQAFKDRKTAGLNLSDRVWLYTNQYKDEIEMAIDTSIADKVSAQELSQKVRQYLREPDKLFRRVRDERGVLQLSKSARAYHPGRGVYRSSYKNAMRLSRTEINMAYRTADHDSMLRDPFTTGFEVVLSNNHPVEDICNDLAGKYPKDFKFTGWHPQCRCHVISLLVSDSEFNAVEDRLLSGEDVSGYSSPANVKDVPDGMKEWIDKNTERASGWKDQPYWIKDNFVEGDLGKGLKL